MANDPQSLLSQSSCYLCFGATDVQAMELALLAAIAGGGSGDANAVTTDAGIIITTGGVTITASG